MLLLRVARVVPHTVEGLGNCDLSLTDVSNRNFVDNYCRSLEQAVGRDIIEMLTIST